VNAEIADRASEPLKMALYQMPKSLHSCSSAMRWFSSCWVITLAILGEHLMIIELLEVTYFSNLARLPSMPRNVPWSVSVPTCMVTCVVTCMVLVEKVFEDDHRSQPEQAKSA